MIVVFTATEIAINSTKVNACLHMAGIYHFRFVFCPTSRLQIETTARLQRITFAAETNAACSRGSADTQTHTQTHTDAERHSTFSIG